MRRVGGRVGFHPPHSHALAAAGAATDLWGINPHPGVGPLPGQPAGLFSFIRRLDGGERLRRRKRGEGGCIIIFPNGSQLLGAFKVPFVFPQVRLGRARPRAARCRPPLSACLRSRLLAGIRRPRTSDLLCGWWEK